MLKRVLSFASLALLLAGLNSCAKQTDENIANELSQDVQDKILALGFSPQNAKEADGGYIVEGDIFLAPEDLDKTLDYHILRVGDEEQYHTTNLVTGLPRNIKVWINAGNGGNKLPTSYIAALDLAIQRYNNENLSITFSRVNSSNGANIQIKKGNGNFLASAGFPTSGGNPYGTIKVNSNAIGNQPQGTVASLLAHEMGHCIGFRHTDFMNRAYSCGGQAVNEGSAGVGAIHITGTPTGPDANSWMLSCIGQGDDRPFTNNDKTALDYLY
ncbi:MAG: hypothetical protein KDC65_04205 [Saprospiraceae bacterium]|nr:hypothetical protein [Saprospiraceae bacterium]